MLDNKITNFYFVFKIVKTLRDIFLFVTDVCYWCLLLMFVAEHYVGFIRLTSLYEYTSIVILISELPVEFTKPLTDQTVKEKETLTLTCELNKPDLPVKWLKNGKEFKPTDRIQFSVDQYLHQLVITEVTLEDAAKYRCVCKDVSTTCTIKVEGIYISFSLKTF